MSATNGSLFRKLVTCMVAVFALSAVLAATASAKPVPITSTQLTLGDSLAIGPCCLTICELCPAC